MISTRFDETQLKESGAAIRLALFLSVAAGAGTLSIFRLYLKADQRLGDLVWAEDGLFPLCIRKVGMWDCLRDPFAGYLLGVPRLLAGIPAIGDVHYWGWITNIVAATSWGLLSGLVAYWMVSHGFAVLPSFVLAVLPVVIPLVGLESVNSVASIYMPLLYAATAIAAVGWQSRTDTWIASSVFFLSAVTIPTAVFLLAVLGVAHLKGRISRAATITSGVVLVVGLVLQSLVVATAQSRRDVTVSGESISYWFNDLPNALLTVWPGLYFGEVTIFGIFTLPVVVWSGAAVALAFLVLGLRASFSSDDAKSIAGLFILSGLAYSFVPTATGYASNRYFVLTVLGVLAAGLLLLYKGVWGNRRWIFACVIALFAVAWVPAFPASEWRSTPSPEWTSVVQRAVELCRTDPMAPVGFEFSPNWPQEGITELQAPTNVLAPCSVIGMPEAR